MTQEKLPCLSQNFELLHPRSTTISNISNRGLRRARLAVLEFITEENPILADIDCRMAVEHTYRSLCTGKMTDSDIRYLPLRKYGKFSPCKGRRDLMFLCELNGIE